MFGAFVTLCCASLAAWIGLHDSYVAWKHGFVRLGRSRARKLYRADDPRLFRINVVGNALVALMGVTGVAIAGAALVTALR